jgi:hypothetical protein
MFCFFHRQLFHRRDVICQLHLGSKLFKRNRMLWGLDSCGGGFRYSGFRLCKNRLAASEEISNAASRQKYNGKLLIWSVIMTEVYQS